MLAPGMNTDGALFLKEAPWMDFAKRNNLGVIALNYSSSEEDLYQNRKGYYRPEQGSRQALLNEIKRVYGKDLPIVLYGFSGGAQFVSRFVDCALAFVIGRHSRDKPSLSLLAHRLPITRSTVAGASLSQLKNFNALSELNIALAL